MLQTQQNVIGIFDT